MCRRNEAPNQRTSGALVARYAARREHKANFALFFDSGGFDQFLNKFSTLIR